MKKHIPNFITSLNLALGFIAIIFAANGDISTSAWLIMAAMIFDYFDGLSARLLKSYSDIGRELDSLADVVSFGVAPGIIIYQLLYNSLAIYSPALFNTSNIGPLLIFIIPSAMPVCAALRLAKFNIDTTQSTSFKGLPTPANALVVISIVIAEKYSDSEILTNITGSATVVLILTLILSLLMVSRIPLFSLKTTHLKLKGNEGRYLMIIMVVISFVILGFAAAPLIIPVYIIASLFSLIFKGKS